MIHIPPARPVIWGAAMVIDGSSPSSSVIRHLSFQSHHLHVSVHSNQITHIACDFLQIPKRTASCGVGLCGSQLGAEVIKCLIVADICCGSERTERIKRDPASHSTACVLCIKRLVQVLQTTTNFVDHDHFRSVLGVLDILLLFRR